MEVFFFRRSKTQRVVPMRQIVSILIVPLLSYCDLLLAWPEVSVLLGLPPIRLPPMDLLRSRTAARCFCFQMGLFKTICKQVFLAQHFQPKTLVSEMLLFCLLTHVFRLTSKHALWNVCFSRACSLGSNWAAFCLSQGLELELSWRAAILFQEIKMFLVCFFLVCLL